jgi:hypothetical protein
LLGDNTPRRIDSSGTVDSMSNSPKLISTAPLSRDSSQGSVWNGAGTWEEKSVTQWATDTLKRLLLSCSCTLPDSEQVN